MARIRTIKPEFWVDGTNLDLSDSCALFFVGLWNFCDDEGKHRLSLNQLCAELGGRWRKDKISLFLLCLAKTGQIRVSRGAEWIQITGWLHQKIDKPKQPEVKAEEIQWLNEIDSAKALEGSRGINASIGKDSRERRGSERIITPPSCEEDVSAKPVAVQEIPKKKEQPVTSPTWEAYTEAYKQRYRVEPTRNAMVNGQLAHFVKRVPIEEAPAIAAFYVHHSNGLYLSAGHAVSLLLRDAEKLRTEWLTGNKITRNTVRAVESRDHFAGQLQEIAGGQL